MSEGGPPIGSLEDFLCFVSSGVSCGRGINEILSRFDVLGRSTLVCG
ncbi:uncharacterized protein FIBRA_09605 [Fibroporia radiculosa]|uniref:Uncharacterized protein n=1 Tax=Fibroporia radiculosa TaxID=599839 RepID=J7SD78_9APHY|nr:uncharacterized protein FIBRA_09605 [Fibroporia radiculosa]CCM07258.1 predicted protein [Fibroporia radiculosa]